MATISCSNTTKIGREEDGLTFESFAASWAANISCGPASYIRPNDAGSILPWPYTLAWFLLHFPITLIRVHRWERVQALSIILALMTIYFQLQAYANGLEAEYVLVWMPIFVVLDIGAMKQLVFLIAEESGWRPLGEAILGTFDRVRRRSNAQPNASLRREEADDNTSDEGEGRVERTGKHSTRGSLVGRAWLAFLAFMLGLCLLALQLYGLDAAVRGQRRNDITATWCSPLFTRGIAAQTSGCSIQPIERPDSDSIGCIRLRGYDQYLWLKASIVLISISLVFEVFDFVVLALVNGSARWRGIKMRRPWFTMFTGNVVLVVMIVVGVFQCQRLPKSVAERIPIYSAGQGLGEGHVCIAEIVPYGVRGAIIGWTDGFLRAWGGIYQPKHN